ncbi:MAG TPA: MFS transporter [Tepidisphaeraceae bacterium]|nr:MFS transporter [Tepidisphaeraceae bacterium]
MDRKIEETGGPHGSGTIAEREISALAAAGEPAPGVTQAAAAGHPAGLLDRRYVTAAMMLVMVLASMEMTVTSTAMPTIIGELHGLEHYAWVASIYLLACTVSMPLYGRLADAVGRKKVVLTAIGLFCIASVLAAASKTMGQLIVFRGLQGLGAGGIMPVVLTILGDIFTLEERATIQGFFSAVWGSASLAGPALGAFLVNTFGWRSIFFVNLPFGVIGMIVLAWKYHDKEKPHSVDLDLPGVALLAISCAALLLLVSRLGPDGWDLPRGLGLTIIALGTAAWFVRVERLSANPILPMSLVMHRAIGPSLVGSCLLGVGFLSLDTYVPLYVQGAKGGGATAAAGVVTPVMLAWATSGIFAAPLVVRWGFRKTAMLGSILTIVSFTGLVACAMIDSPHWILTGVLLISGFGFGPASMAYLLAAQDAVEWKQRGIVTSSIQFFRTIGGAVGIGVLGMMFNILTQSQMRSLREAGVNPGALLDPHSRSLLAPDVLQSASSMFGHGLTWVFGGMLLCAAGQALVTLVMPGHKAARAITAAEVMEGMSG